MVARGAVYEQDYTGRRIKIQPGPLFPAISLRLRDRHGFVDRRALHLPLDCGRCRQVPVEKPKLMLGQALGSVIRYRTAPPANRPMTASASRRCR